MDIDGSLQRHRKQPQEENIEPNWTNFLKKSEDTGFFKKSTLSNKMKKKKCEISELAKRTINPELDVFILINKNIDKVQPRKRDET